MKHLRILLLLFSGLMNVHGQRFSNPFLNNVINNNCFDKHRLCPFWSDSDECTKNPDYMLENCRFSCKVCNLQRPNQPQSPIETMSASKQVQLRDAGVAFELGGECNGLVQTFEVPTRIVPNGQEFRDRAFRMSCAFPNQPNICKQNLCFHKNFRSIDGSCNNPNVPMKGAAYTAYVRILEPNYEDGLDRMIGKCCNTNWERNGGFLCKKFDSSGTNKLNIILFILGTTPGERPNPRDVTHLLLSTNAAITTKFNGLLMIWGQFFSHDVTRIAMINFCRCSTNSPQCANIPIPPHDPRPGQCIPFTRTVPLCGTGPAGSAPRTQVNENTAFIDASHIYGSDPRTASELRQGPFLLTQTIARRFVFPPRSGNDSIRVGDSRVNLFIGLASMHTLCVRLHNKLVRRLGQINPHWNEERLYQETRKIIGAIVQVITYQEFFPILLGDNWAKLVPEYTGYKPEVEPAISGGFSAAAFRLHGMIREFYRLVDDLFRVVGEIRFVDGTGQVEQLLNMGTDLLIRGMITVSSKAPQRMILQVTEELFGFSDMGTLNIQRGRDVGLSTYNSYRQFCNLPRITSFNEWPEVSNPDVRQRVSVLYNNNPNRLDLYVGGILEEPKGGALVGPTFACIIAEQMMRLRDGDRFFYRNPQQYSETQIKSFSDITIARFICETGENIRDVPVEAFLVDNGSGTVPCSQIPPINLEPWRETPRK